MSAFSLDDDSPSALLTLRVNAALKPYLRVFAGAFTGLYVVLAVLHFVATPPDIALVMAPLAALTALAGAVIMVMLRRRQPPRFIEDHLLSLTGSALMVNSAVHLLVSQDMVQSTNLAITVVVLGLFLFRWRAFIALTAACISAFGVTAALTAHPLTFHFAIHLGEAVLAAVLTFVLKRRISLSQIVADDGMRRALARAEQLSREREHHMHAALEAASAKTRFLATMSHELRTPLNAVIGFSHFLKDDAWIAENPDKAAEYARDISGSGEYLLGLINDILDYAKAAEGKTTLQRDVIDARELAQVALSSIRPLAVEKEIVLATDGLDTLPPLYGDEIKLKQVFVNLLSNAVKFTPPGGAVTFSGIARDGGVSFSVADTGIGIAAEDLARVFEPFVQADSTLSRVHSGTGLGLPLVKAITELHGGRVALDSEPGKGTIVSLHFPEGLLAANRAAA